MTRRKDARQSARPFSGDVQLGVQQGVVLIQQGRIAEADALFTSILIVGLRCRN